MPWGTAFLILFQGLCKPPVLRMITTCCLCFRLFSLFLLVQEIRHAVQADGQSRGIVQQCGGSGLDHTRHTQDNKHQIEGDDKPVISVNTPHQRLADFPQRHQLEEICGDLHVKSSGVKQLMAGGVALIGITLVILFSGLFG